MARDRTAKPAWISRPESATIGLEELLWAADRAAEAGSPAAREWIIQMIYQALDRAPGRATRLRSSRDQPADPPKSGTRRRLH